MNLYTEALSSIPGYEAADAAFRRIDHLRSAATQDRPDAGPDLAQAVAADLMAGKEPAKDLGSKALKAAQAANEHVARLKVLEDARLILAKRVDEYHTDQRDAALLFLSGRMADLVERVKAADAALGDVSSADEAIAADRVSAWKTCAEAHSEYVAIREAEAKLNSVYMTKANRGPAPGSDRRTRALSACGWSSNPADWDAALGGSKDPVLTGGVQALREFVDVVRVATSAQLAEDYEALTNPPVQTDAFDMSPSVDGDLSYRSPEHRKAERAVSLNRAAQIDVY